MEVRPKLDHRLAPYDVVEQETASVDTPRGRMMSKRDAWRRNQALAIAWPAGGPSARRRCVPFSPAASP